MTGRQLIMQALMTLGSHASGDSLDDTDAVDGLVWLNQIVDRLATQHLAMPVLLRTTKTLTASTVSYTVGTGGAINIVRPGDIVRAALVPDPSATTPIEVPIEVYSQDAWSRIPIKTLTATLIAGIYYDRAFAGGLGSISVFPIPTVSTLQLVIYTRQALTAFALDTDVSLPPGLAEALETALALRLAVPFDVPVPERLPTIAAEAMADYKRSNYVPQMLQMQTDAPLGDAGRGLYTYRDFLAGAQ